MIYNIFTSYPFTNVWPVFVCKTTCLAKQVRPTDAIPVE